MRISTLVNAGYPYAIAARLYPEFCAQVHLVASTLKVESFTTLADNSDVLIMGDLPAPPEEDPFCPALRRWLTQGGKLLYYAGWKDSLFLRRNSDLLGVEIAESLEISAAPEDIKWNKAENVPQELQKLPSIRFLHSLRSVHSNAKTLIVTEKEVPVVVSARVGNGLVVTVLCPISFPAGGEWLAWAGFVPWMRKLLEIEHVPHGTTQANLHIETYSRILTMLSRGENSQAVATLMQEIPIVGQKDQLLASEMCQVLNIIGRQSADAIAVLYSLRYLADFWPRDVKIYDYEEYQYHWVRMKHEIDKAILLNTSARSYVQNAMESLDKHIEGLGHQSKVPQLDRDRLEGVRNWLAGLYEITNTVEQAKSNQITISSINRAVELLQHVSSSSFSHPRLGATLLTLKLAQVLIKGPATLNDPQVQMLMNELRKEAQRFAGRLDGADFATTAHAIASFLERLLDDDEATAWASLGMIADPFGRSVVNAVLRLRQGLQLDPLGFIPFFGRLETKVRTSIARRLVEAASLHVEHEPLVVLLVFLQNQDIARKSSSLLSNISLQDSDAPKSLAIVSRIWDTIISEINGAIIDARQHSEPNSASAARTRIESRIEMQARKLSTESHVLAKISAKTGVVRISTDNISLVHRRGNWQISSLITIEALIGLLKGLSKNEAKILVNILGDVQAISESATYPFHGTTIVASRESLELKGLHISPSLPLRGLSERALAGIFLADGACFINLASKDITHMGARLFASEPAFDEAIKINRWLQNRGMRHKSGVAFSLDHPSAYVFICSEDGGCLAISRGQVSRLW